MRLFASAALARFDFCEFDDGATGAGGNRGRSQRRGSPR